MANEKTPEKKSEKTEPKRDGKSVSRRNFMEITAGAAALGAWAIPSPTFAAPGDDIEVAIIGSGSQGRNLMMMCTKIKNVKFRAVCDVWSYSQDYASKLIGKFGHKVNVYEDYRDMLAKEKTLNAVIIASPDCVHAEHTNACLRAGLDVYCEKEMSNTIEGAASMVRAQRDTGKLLQIGHQRRSNPRYHLGTKLIKKDKVLGTITHVSGQWNRRHRLDLGWPKGREMDPALLKKYGYETMDQYRNWRNYRQFSGGPIADLGSHQIDIFSWYLNAHPTSVMASGGIDYYKTKGRDWYDNIFTIYTFDTVQNGKEQTVRGIYQVLNTTSHGGFFETFMGDGGTLVVSEDTSKGFFFREPTENQRMQWEDQSKKVDAMGAKAITLKVGASLKAKKDPKTLKLLADAKKAPHLLHLENFFEAVAMNKASHLTCPVDIGYETAVSVLTANVAVDQKKQIDFTPDMFKV